MADSRESIHRFAQTAWFSRIVSGWEPVDHLQGSLGPSGPETPKKSEKSLPGPPAPGPPESLEKVSKKSGESGKSLEKVPKDFFETFSRLSGGPGAGGPGRLFSDFFGVSGPEGPRDPCKWSTGSQNNFCCVPDTCLREKQAGARAHLRKGLCNSGVLGCFWIWAGFWASSTWRAFQTFLAFHPGWGGGWGRRVPGREVGFTFKQEGGWACKMGSTGQVSCLSLEVLTLKWPLWAFQGVCVCGWGGGS